MRNKATTAIVVTVFLHAVSLSASCKTEACQQAMAWKRGYVAIVLKDAITRNEYTAVLNAIKTKGGSVAIEADRVMLGWLSTSGAAELQKLPAVLTVLDRSVASPSAFDVREKALSALAFFNHVQTGEYEDAVEKGLTVQGAPLTNCVGAGAPTSGAYSRGNGGASSTEPNSITRSTSGRGKGSIASNFWYHTSFMNAEMKGRITVQVFRLDSDGTIDQNRYSWTQADMNVARDQVYGAFTFWVDQANLRGVSPPPSFRVNFLDPFSRYIRGYVPTPTKYEPIHHPSTDDYFWMNDALARVGYGSSPVTTDNVFTQNDALNAAQAADPIYGPFDHSFTTYIVYNPETMGAPNVFTDGQRAFVPWADGPEVTIMWNSAGWGSSNLGRVLTHETGHIFWACDEYYDAPSNTGCASCKHCWFNVGPRNQVVTPWITNGNCPSTIDGSGALCTTHVSCMMNNTEPVLCEHTPQQIGW